MLRIRDRSDRPGHTLATGSGCKAKRTIPACGQLPSLPAKASGSSIRVIRATGWEVALTRGCVARSGEHRAYDPTCLTLRISCNRVERTREPKPDRRIPMSSSEGDRRSKRLTRSCAACGERKARFRYRGEVRADRDHTLCFACYRGEINRARARRLSDAAAPLRMRPPLIADASGRGRALPRQQSAVSGHPSNRSVAVAWQPRASAVAFS
jgi:hypothetical protein